MKTKDVKNIFQSKDAKKFSPDTIFKLLEIPYAEVAKKAISPTKGTPISVGAVFQCVKNRLPLPWLQEIITAEINNRLEELDLQIRYTSEELWPNGN